METESARNAGLLVAGLTLVVVVGCSRRQDDPNITAAPERAAAAASPRPDSPLPVAAVADASVPNPLEMHLKHDGPPPGGTVATKDPCAIAEPTGPLAMPLRHGAPNAPGQRNPLCMRLK